MDIMAFVVYNQADNCGVAARHDHHKLSIVNLQLSEANYKLSIIN
jgi:hypothetical protein